MDQGRVRRQDLRGVGGGNSLETLYTQLDRELYSSQPRLTPPLFSYSFFFIPEAPLSEGFDPREHKSRGRLLSTHSVYLSALYHLPRSSCFRALHSTVKGKVCNEISSERSSRIIMLGARGGELFHSWLLVIVASNWPGPEGVHARFFVRRRVINSPGAFFPSSSLQLGSLSFDLNLLAKRID